jgi:hypothetical protein
MPHILTVTLNPAVDLFTEVHETRSGHDFRFVLPGPTHGSRRSGPAATLHGLDPGQ